MLLEHSLLKSTHAAAVLSLDTAPSSYQQEEMAEQARGTDASQSSPLPLFSFALDETYCLQPFVFHQPSKAEATTKYCI